MLHTMKLKFSILFLITCSFAFGQDYKSIVAEANHAYDGKDYAKSVTLYKEAFRIEKKNTTDLYNAGCSAALAGDRELAFEWLNLAFKNGWTNVKHFKSDTDLASLHNTPEWDKLVAEMQKESDRIEAGYDKPLQAKLLSIFDEDQGIRRQFIAAQKQYGYKSRQVDSLGKVMMFKDSINLIRVTEILDHNGWVGPDKVGRQASQTLFLVIQHADLKTQQKYLPFMREAVKNKKTEPSALALLEDRVALREGRRQIYGSQVGLDEQTQKHYVLPLEDPDNVDRRRAGVGLGPLADYVKTWDIVWNVEEYKKQLPAIEAKQK